MVRRPFWLRRWQPNASTSGRHPPVSSRHRPGQLSRGATAAAWRPRWTERRPASPRAVRPPLPRWRSRRAHRPLECGRKPRRRRTSRPGARRRAAAGFRSSGQTGRGGGVCSGGRAAHGAPGSAATPGDRPGHSRIRLTTPAHRPTVGSAASGAPHPWADGRSAASVVRPGPAPRGRANGGARALVFLRVARFVCLAGVSASFSP